MDRTLQGDDTGGIACWSNVEMRFRNQPGFEIPAFTTSRKICWVLCFFNDTPIYSPNRSHMEFLDMLEWRLPGAKPKGVR